MQIDLLCTVSRRLEKPLHVETKNRLSLAFASQVSTSAHDVLMIELVAQGEGDSWRQYNFKCDDETDCMHWVNSIMQSIAGALAAKAQAFEEQAEMSGSIRMGQVGDLVRSLGGDLKYIKDDELEEMKRATPTEIRRVAGLVGHEVSFKDARAMAADMQGGDDTEIGLVHFLVMMAFKMGWDTAFVLAYGIIQLNTDAHSSKLEGMKRMTRDQFIENNRRSPDLATLPTEYLGVLYDEIVSNEIKMEHNK